MCHKNSCRNEDESNFIWNNYLIKDGYTAANQSSVTTMWYNSIHLELQYERMSKTCQLWFWLVCEQQLPWVRLALPWQSPPLRPGCSTSNCKLFRGKYYSGVLVQEIFASLCPPNLVPTLTCWVVCGRRSWLWPWYLCILSLFATGSSSLSTMTPFPPTILRKWITSFSRSITYLGSLETLAC